MTQSRIRQGKTLRSLLFALVMIGILPVLMVGMYVRGRAADHEDLFAQRDQNPSLKSRQSQRQQLRQQIPKSFFQVSRELSLRRGAHPIGSISE